MADFFTCKGKWSVLIYGLLTENFIMKNHIITAAFLAFALAPLSQAQDPAPADPQPEAPSLRIYVNGTELPAEIAEDIAKNGVLEELLKPAKRTDTPPPAPAEEAEEEECTCTPECRCGEEDAPTCSTPPAPPAPAPATSAEVKTDANGELKVIINGKEYTPKHSKIIRMRVRITEDGKAIAEPVE